MMGLGPRHGLYARTAAALIAFTLAVGTVHAALLAQIDPLGTVNGSLQKAAEVGAAITALVLLIVIAVAFLLVMRLYYRNQHDERNARIVRENNERNERAIERAAREAERKMYVEAAATANHINQMLMDRLEELTKTHTQMELNVGVQTEGIVKLMAAIEVSETTRAERYKQLFDRQETTEDALNNVASELHGVKQSVDTLTQTVQQVKGLTDDDRSLITELVGRVNSLFDRLEGKDHETTNDSPDPDAAAAVTIASAGRDRDGAGLAHHPDGGAGGASDGPTGGVERADADPLAKPTGAGDGGSAG